VAQGLLDRAVGLSQSLRQAGVPVSLAESLDSAGLAPDQQLPGHAA
jgi:hypothetical protein